MTSQFDHDDHQLTLDWNTDAIVDRRNRYYAASQRAFVPYQKPLIFSRGQDQYLWDEKGNRYLDCLSQNLTISVGYNNPVVTRAAGEQAQTPRFGFLILRRAPGFGDVTLRFLSFV